MNIKYKLFDPAKNYTIIVTTSVKENDRRFVASKLMEIEPLAEQVGFLEGNILNMAGGEFCGNAVRCASMISNTNSIVCSGLEIKTSGFTAFIPKDLDGIKHYIFETEIDSPEEKIKQEANGRAVGFMFWNEEKQFLKPLVYVPTADTLFWENSCASGTAALASYLANKYNKEIILDVNEPGGTLHVETSPADKFVKLDGEISILKEGEICIPELAY